MNPTDPQYDTQQQVYEKIVCIVLLSFVFRNIYIKSENFTLFVCNEFFFYIVCHLFTVPLFKSHF